MVMLSGGGENMVRVIQQQQLQQHGQQQQLQQGQYNVCVFLSNRSDQRSVYLGSNGDDVRGR